MKKYIKLLGLLSLLTSVSLIASDKDISLEVKKCTACHGQHFEKRALGQSKIVKDRSKEQIINALNGYKEGTYGFQMKGVMAGQVKSFDKEDILKLAEIIKPEDNNLSQDSNETNSTNSLDINKSK